MNEAQKEQMAAEDKIFVVAFIIGLIVFGFFLLFLGAFGGLGFLKIIILEPILYPFTVIVFSFGYATLTWIQVIRRNKKQEGKF